MSANEKHTATYHGGEYTPTTAIVHSIYMTAWNSTADPVDQQEIQDKARDEFTRWLEQVRAEAKREALNEYADTLGYRISGATIKYGQCHIEAHDIIRELHDRANQYKENQ